MTFYKLIATAIVQFFFICANSQTIPQENTYTIDSVSRQVERRYQVKLFYKEEWFKNKIFHPSITGHSLEDIISLLKNSCNCEVISPDSLSFVFIPNDAVNINVPGSQLNVVTIGNPAEYGKYARANITGKILDAKTGQPLPGARLVVEKQKTGAVSDKNGRFNINLPVGAHDLKLSYMGFQDNIQRINLLSNGSLNFEIIEKTIRLNEVIITAERTDNNFSGTQMSLVQLTARDIKELPVSFGERDILKSMTLLPGIQSVGEFGTGFNVRGGSPDQNLILVEDVPLFNTSHVFGLTSILNPGSIQNVSVAKGGIPARYGERAASVMDIQMVDQAEKVKVRGGVGLINSGINIEAPLFRKKVNIILGARTTYSDWLLKQMPDLELKNSSAKFYDLNALVTLNPDNKSKITLFAYSSGDDFTFNRIDDYSYKTELASFRWNYILNQKVSSSLVAGISNYSYGLSEYDSIYPTDAYRIKSGIRYKNAKYNISWHPSNDQAIEAGASAVFYVVEPGEVRPVETRPDENTIPSNYIMPADNITSLVKPVTVQRQKADEFSVYISDRYSITEKISVEAGLRYTWYALLGPATVNQYLQGNPRSTENIIDSVSYGNNRIIQKYDGLEPRISLKVGVDQRSSVKISYNRINQYINLASNSAVVNPSDIWKLSDSFLQPLRCDQIALGYFRNFSNDAIETSLELYYKNLQNSIEYKNNAKLLVNPHLETELVNAKGYNYGAEIYVRKNSGRLTGWASYTFSRSMRRTTGIYAPEQINDNRYFPSNYDRPHNIILNANYHISRRWRFSGTFTFNSGRPVSLPELKYTYKGYRVIYYSERNKYRLPDYHRLDVSITLDESLRLKKFWKGSWTFSIVNLYGRKNAYSVFYQKVSPSESNGFRNYSLFKMYIIGRPLPTLTYNFSF